METNHDMNNKYMDSEIETNKKVKQNKKQKKT